MIDYQIHTVASDGAFPPRACVKMAKENGLVSIAITDHDTVGGIDEALAAGREFDIEVIPGIEISAEDGCSVHILGYGIDHRDPELLATLSSLANTREERAKKMVEKLKEFGFAIEYEKVRARAEGVVARPHIVAEILENPLNKEKLEAENIATPKDVFDKYLGDHAPAFVSHMPFTPKDAIEAISKAGGVPVWSHPTVPMGDYQKIEDALGRYMKFGLLGLEVLGSFFSEDDTEFLHGLAEKYGLIRTAGSDFHDTFVRENHPEGGAARVGGYNLFGYSIDGIREKLLEAIASKKTPVAPQPSI